MQQCREGFAKWSHHGHYVLKCISHTAFKQDKETAAAVVGLFILEAKILKNLALHPHILGLYGMSLKEVLDAEYGCKLYEQGVFLFVDEISETLPQLMQRWRDKKGYEGERFNKLAARQSQITQRLEVSLDISSAMVFLSDQNLVYHLHPTKVGFD